MKPVSCQELLKSANSRLCSRKSRIPSLWAHYLFQLLSKASHWQTSRQRKASESHIYQVPSTNQSSRRKLLNTTLLSVNSLRQGIDTTIQLPRNKIPVRIVTTSAMSAHRAGIKIHFIPQSKQFSFAKEKKQRIHSSHSRTSPNINQNIPVKTP